MKFTTFLLFVAFMQVSAKGLAQRLTLVQKNATLKQVFKEINKQTGYNIYWSDSQLNSNQIINANFKDALLLQVLDKVLENTKLTYTIENKTVIIKEKPLTISQKINVIPSIPFTISGKVTDTLGTPLIGATVADNNSGKGAITNDNGEFSINAQPGDRIVVTYIGYIFYSFTVAEDLPFQHVILHTSSGKLGEVIVSTGYQTIPQERATGSFVTLDNNLLNRRVSTDILSRIEDVASGVVFNRNVPGRTNDITIRGQSTLFSNAQPLIVLDNFPYDGDLTNINPNDIENITILKDAAAASIWGTRAGNGVIVITTKKGNFNKPLHISFNSNVTVGNKPDLFYQSKMSTSDFINVEKLLFSKVFFAGAENSPNHAPITPVVELLIAARDGVITQASANSQIDALRSNDVRNDFNKYFYQKSINQQYALNLNGGTDIQKYQFSVGYDKNQDNLVRNGFQRLNINANNTYSFLNHKLELTTGLYLTQSNITTDNQGIGSVVVNGLMGLYPYAKLADAAGGPLPIVKDYRTSFAQSAQQQGLLNWQYYPINELNLADNTSTITDYRLNARLSYKILPQLFAEALYLYERGITNGRNYQSQDTYNTRNLINSYTQVNSDGTLSHPVPLGGIVDQSNQSMYTNDFRGQLNYDQDFGLKNNLTAIAGYEVRSLHTLANTYRLYGYDNAHAISSPVDYITQYNQYYYPGLANTVPYNDSGSDLKDNNISYYTNAAYTYDKKYVISGSARFDESNLFGVKANQKGVPLWSAGAAWIFSDEAFYKVDWLPYLKMRVTYGVSGNVNKSVSAYTTAYYFNGAYTPINQAYASLINPPDPDLTWERIKSLNFGVDFRMFKHIISGSFEYYRKDGVDLIGSTPIAPSTGTETFTGNNASTTGHGVDLVLNSNNLQGIIKWQTNFLLSYNTNKVSNYKVDAPVASYLQFGYGGDNIPLQGKPLYAIYSYKWAGLDPQTGNPRGYLNGAASENYAAIIAAATPENIVYNGPAQPTFFGSFRNSIGWNGINVSANITYRLGYYFRKTSVRYSTVLRDQGGSGDYSLRWQKPGDETHTHVPSVPSAINFSRDNLYTFSNVLVGKGGNIRLQDLSLSYDILKSVNKGSPFSHASVYLYANNLDLLWKANKFGIDPDYQNGPPPKTIALGFKADFK